MSATFRKATVQDADQISEIFLASRKLFISYAPLAHSDEAILIWVREKLVTSGEVTVAEQEGKIVGMMALSRDETYGWIDHIYLCRAIVGQGIGGQLIDQAKKSLDAPIRLYTFQENIQARRFYARHGFVEIELTDGQTNEEKIPDVLLEWRG